MRYLHAGLILLIISSLCDCRAHAQSIAGEPLPVSVTLDVPAPSLSGRDSTQVVVHLPISYRLDPDRLYPVVFYLHGWGSDAGEFERLGGVRALRALPDDRAMIVVAVSGETSGYRNWADGESSWEDHLTGSVNDVITSRFRVSMTRKARALYGVSMGGAAALRIAISGADMFACAASHSAAISPIEFDDQPEWQKSGYLEMEDFPDRYGNPFDDKSWKAANPLYLALTADAEALRSVEFYFDVGMEDHLGFADDNAALSQALAKRSIPHTFVLRTGGHGGSFVEANIDHAIRFLSQCVSSDSLANPQPE